MISRLGRGCGVTFCKLLYQKPIRLPLGVAQPVHESPESRSVSTERHKAVARQDERDAYHPLVEP